MEKNTEKKLSYIWGLVWYLSFVYDERDWKRIFNNMAAARGLKNLWNTNLSHFSGNINRLRTLKSANTLKRCCRCASTFSFVPDSPPPLHGEQNSTLN